MISLERLEEMFANMRAQTTWNVDGILVWGYFFTDMKRKKLERAAESLIRAGYRLVRLYQTDDCRFYVLQVEREEKHTPQTLHVRNSELERLAEEFDLHSYDGMEVGPTPVAEPGAEHRN